MNTISRFQKVGTALLAWAMPVVALAQGFGPVQGFAGTSQSDLITSIYTIINIFLVLAAIVAVIFLILGGIQYITSQGDEEKATKAKNTILYAVIGLIVIGISAAIANFAIGSIPG